MMDTLLKLARVVDVLNTRVGHTVRWLILLTVVISAGNAFVRKVFQTSSNALLEVQWYLFAAVFLLCAGYVFLNNLHVRIDIVSAQLTPRVRSWIDIVGIALFLVPLCWMMIYMSWPLVAAAWHSGEVSANAGGLVRWPVYLMVPLGMLLLLLQGLSELIKRVAFLLGRIPDPLANEGDQWEALTKGTAE
jgi:TRAP-type mannitol/chloroaromatic compound transport system permease small subunit